MKTYLVMWSHVSEPHSETVRDAAKTSGVTGLMSREEIEQYEDVYNKLRQVDDARLLAWDTLNDASQYQFTNSRLSLLTPTQIAGVTTLTQAAMNKHWLEGVALENMAAKYKDFSPSITRRIGKSSQTRKFHLCNEGPRFRRNNLPDGGGRVWTVVHWLRKVACTKAARPKVYSVL